MSTLHTKLSSGNPFLDKILSGGFSLGNIILIIEDSPTKIYQSLIKYNISEGWVNKEHIFFYPGTQQASDIILNNLPYQSTQIDAILNSKSKEISSTSSTQTEMKIAWRYENIQYTNLISDVAKSLKYVFDLSRQLQDNLYSKTQITTSKVNSIKSWTEKIVSDYQIYTENFSDKESEKYVRIIVPNIFQFYKDVNRIKEVHAYLNALKVLSRCINGTLMITVNENVGKEIRDALLGISDYVIKIKSWIMLTEKDQVGDYHGIIYLEKLPSFCTLRQLPIETDIYGLLRDKRKIIIEKIDIGVEVDRNTKVKENDITNRNNYDNEKKGSCCGVGDKFDF